jgi:hypothetical protein
MEELVIEDNFDLIEGWTMRLVQPSKLGTESIGNRALSSTTDMEKYWHYQDRVDN